MAFNFRLKVLCQVIQKISFSGGKHEYTKYTPEKCTKVNITQKKRKNHFEREQIDTSAENKV